MLKTYIMNTRRRQTGQVIPLVALTLTTLLGFAGTGVDVGYWEYSQRQQQNVTDAAAIAGAQALDAAGCNSQTAAQAAALADATGYTSSQVNAHNPPITGAYSGNTCAVSVAITGSKPSFFGRIFGKTSMAETTSAVALLQSNNNNCIYLTSTSATSTFSGGAVSAAGCGVSANGPVKFCGKSFSAARIGYSGAAPTVCGGTTFTSATPAPQLQGPDPCAAITGCNSLAKTPPPSSNCTTLKANMNPTIGPGCYNNLTVGGCGTVTMQPGVYVLNGTSDFSGSSFVGSGVTFYVTANGTAPDFSASQSATITPPTTGTLANVLYYQVPSNTSAPNFAGSSVRWKGLVYAPGATGVNFNGASGDYTVLVLGSANLTSTSGYTFATPPSGSTLVQNVVLAQ